MASSTIIQIGSVPKYRGAFNSDIVYYIGNIITYYGCVFRAINQVKGYAPIKVNSDGTISLNNTNYWECIVDNVELYNTALQITSYEKLLERVDSIDFTVRRNRLILKHD